MIVKTEDEIHATRLQLEGYDRQSSHKVETTPNEAMRITERDDVEVRRMDLRRDGSGQEQEIVEREIKRHSGRVRRRYTEAKTPRSSHPEIRTKREMLFKVSDMTLTIYTDFQAVIEDRYQLAEPEGEYRDTVEGVIGVMDDRIEEHQEAINTLNEKQEELRETEYAEFHNLDDE
jgi:hypothetical protein